MAPTNLGRRLRLVVAGAAVVTVLTAAMAAASPPTPIGDAASMGVETPGMARLGASVPAGTDPRTPQPGFLLQRGRYTRFDAPGARGGTSPNSINNRGVIVGYFAEGVGDPFGRGFRRDARGRITTIDLPGASQTKPLRINDRGQISGAYIDTAGRRRGFLLDGDRFVRIDVPGATYTQAFGLNNRGQVVGDYQTSDGRVHGFRWERGRITTVDAPGAAGTTLADINDRGLILGGRLEPDGRVAGFVLDRGRFVTFRAPGVPQTFAFDLNNRGQIVGFTVTPTAADPLAGARGFLLARGASGPFTPVDVPGAPRSAAFGLNDAGAVVGRYENPNATPSPQRDGRPPMGRMA
jgi:probable HAF family extracellular repeat protein